MRDLVSTRKEISKKRGLSSTHHRLDVWMRYRIKFVKLEFELGSNVDISALVFSGITILGCGEYCIVVSNTTKCCGQ